MQQTQEMIRIKKFTFNPFQENTYVLINENKQAIIVDPGMYEISEFDLFFKYLTDEEIIPILLVNTHTHLDHLFGNAAVMLKYKIPLAFHEKDKPVFNAAPTAGAMYNMLFVTSPPPTFYLKEGQVLKLGNDQFKILLTPGHSPGSVCFYHDEQKILISGDVLFKQSVGRSDLPGGDYDTLMNSIKTELLPLHNEVVVYSGHGPETTIGEERKFNPFILDLVS